MSRLGSRDGFPAPAQLGKEKEPGDVEVMATLGPQVITAPGGLQSQTPKGGEDLNVPGEEVLRGEG